MSADVTLEDKLLEARRARAEQLKEEKFGASDSPFVVPSAQGAIARTLLGTATTIGEEVQANPKETLEITGGVAAGTIAGPATGLKALQVLGPKTSALISRMLISGAGAGAGRAFGEATDPDEESLKNIGLSAGAGAAGEGVASGAIAVGGKIARPFVNQLEDAAPSTIRLLGDDAVLTPGRAVDSRIVDTLENISEKSFGGGSFINKATKKASGTIENRIDDFARQFIKQSSKEDVGALIIDAIDEGSDAFRATARGLYNRVDQASEGVTVDIKVLKEAAEEIAERSSEGLGDPTIRRITKAILDKPDDIPFSAAAELRSDLLGVGRGGTDLIAGKAQGAGKKLGAITNKLIEDSGKTIKGEEAVAAFKEANQFWKAGKNTFNSRLIKTLARSEPDVVFDRFIKPGRSFLIRSARETIDDPQIWQNVQGQFVEDLLLRSSNAEGVVGKNLKKNLTKFGDKALSEVLGDQKTVNQFKELSDALTLTQKKLGAEGQGLPGGVFIQLAQAGALLNLATGQGPLDEVQSTAIVLGPAALGFLFTNPTAARWLTTGLKSKPGTAQATRASAQVLAQLIKNGFVKEIQTEE